MKSNSLSWNDKKDRQQLVTILKNGGVAVGPSDTVIGLLTQATKQGVAKLNHIKQRFEKPYILLVDSLDKVGHFAEIPDSRYVKNIMQNCWPGPVTLILKARHESNLYAPHQRTVAVRIPLHKGLLDVLSQFDGLLSTSANRAGAPVPIMMHNVDPEIIKLVDCVITDEDTEGIAPSTILDCSGDQIILLREGAYKIEDLERIADTKFLKS